MSSDDYVYILKQGKEFWVEHRNASTDYVFDRLKFKSLKAAITKAGEIPSEYGITIGKIK